MRFFIFILSLCFLSSSCEQKKTAPTTSLSEFLSSPQIDPQVEELADLGYERYQKNINNLKTDRDIAQAANKSGGGRNDDTWIKDTFNDEEVNLTKKLKEINSPPTFTINEINKLYDDLIALNPRDENLKKAKFVFVTGVNVSYLHQAPLGKDAFLQLASQFNYLESPGTNKTSILSYLKDKTQGPMGSIEAAAAAIHRNAAEDVGKLKNALFNVLPKNHDNYYQNGYLQLFQLSEDENTALLKHIEANIKNLSILPHWVKNEASGVKQFQVFSAAPSYQGKSSPSATSTEGQLTSLLVATQFEALAKLAVIRSLLIKEPVMVHLARVGQGAFNNPPETMNAALKSVSEVVKGYANVHVYVHGFSQGSTDDNIKATDPNLVDISEMDSATFFNTKFPPKA